MNPQPIAVNTGRLRKYAQVGVQSSVETASPHRLILMLLDGATARIAAAAGHLQRGQIAARGESISLAIAIIEGLRGSLNRAEGGALADNLDELYIYMSTRLVQANIDNDLEALREVQKLLAEIRAGWSAIAPAAAPPVQAAG